MKRAIVTGAAGFTGISLVQTLVQHGYLVDAIVRPNSQNNAYLRNVENIHIVEIDLRDEYELGSWIESGCDVAFYLACYGERYDFESQFKNVDMIVRFINELHKIECKRIVGTGSQAEYGMTKKSINEDMKPNPFCAYGAAKVASCYLSQNRAKELEIDWIWARVFSLYGENEPSTRMLPSLIRELSAGKDFYLSSCRQNWDYLHVSDGAEALIALAERGKSGEIYNVANGEYKALKDFVEIIKELIDSRGNIIYGDDPDPFVSLQPDVSKIKRDTGWEPKVRFEDGIKELITGMN